MKLHLIKIWKCLLTLLILAIWTSACQKEETPQPLDEPVNLTISVKIPHMELSRGVSDSPTNPSTWTEWEKLVDGRMLYQVTLFLIEKTTNKLVGYRDIYHGSTDLSNGETDANKAWGANGFSTNGEVDTSLETGTEVTFNFRYDHPIHGASEKLRRGEFMLLAVANHTARDSYAGLKNANGDKLSDIIQTITNNFGNEGIGNFTQSNNTYKPFFDFDIVSSKTTFICDKNAPQALSVVKNIALKPGENHISVELIRTYSRIRIELMNNSSSCNLKVNSLTFSDDFAQSGTYLFDLPDNPDRKFQGFQKGNLTTDHAYTLTSFSATTINKRSSKVVFDAYILESHDDENDGYKYTLDVEYEGKTAFTPSSASTEPAILDEIKEHCFDNVSQVNAYFKIQNTSSGKYLYDNGTHLYQGNENDDSYLWCLLKYNNSTTQCYLYNKGTGRYVGNPNNGQTSMVTINDTYYIIQTHGSGDGFLLNPNNSGYYINNWGGSGTHLGGWNENTDGNSKHQFYMVIPGESVPASYNAPILLKTIDPITSQATQAESILRNDFINVLVTVSFDEMNGNFNFVVKPWEEKITDLEFN